MRLALRLRRLGAALLAAGFLAASFASASHVHPSVRSEDQALRGSAEGRAALELDCALCASAARLDHAAAASAFPPAAPASLRLAAGCVLDAIPARLATAPAEARAPPRLG